jgi:hypothetical protein
MKIKFILFFAMTFFACSKEDNTNSILNGKWKLIKYHNLSAGTSDSEPTNILRSIIIDFSDNGTKGIMDGITVTNTVSGNYELFKKNEMKTLSFGGTKVGEPNWGSKFWNAIQSASSYELQTNKLFIYFNADTEKMEFEKQ